MVVQSHPSSLTGLSDDRLGTIAVSLVVSDLQWSPDIAPAVLDRISRDAVAYPEQFDRRPPPPPPPPRSAESRSAKRTVSRIAVISAVLVVVAVLIVVAAAANSSGATILGLGGLFA